MKVLHVVFGYAPDPPGGTELYVDALCRALGPAGVRSAVAAPAADEAAYDLDGLRVRRFAVRTAPATLTELYAGSDPVAARGFARILDDERPDLVHQHALTHACSLELMRAAKRRGLPVVFTYHTPTTTCQRGTLLEWGRSVCDGRLDAGRCAPCTLNGLGLNVPTSRLISDIPDRVRATMAACAPIGRAQTAFRVPAAVRARIEALSEFLTIPDRFVALSPWVQRLLKVNGVPDERIVMSRHGVRLDPPRARPHRSGDASLAVAHLGRVDPIKGTDILIRAARSVRDRTFRLDIFGVPQGGADAKRLTRLRALASGDARIRFLPPIAPDSVVEALAAYDVVAVPSQCLETGPLVVLEAFTAGVPVIGSALGGIAEHVTDGVDGLLVSPRESVAAWGRVLASLAADPPRARALARGICRPRSMADVANEMATLYRRLAGAADQPVASRASLQSC